MQEDRWIREQPLDQIAAIYKINTKKLHVMYFVFYFFLRTLVLCMLSRKKMFKYQM